MNDFLIRQAANVAGTTDTHHTSDTGSRLAEDEPGRYLWTGLAQCHDAYGHVIECAGTGQDAEFTAGLRWDEKRFNAREQAALDTLTGLEWTLDSNPAGFPLTWADALAHVAAMNRERFAGHADWRMPNRREMRSLISYGERKPALPVGHPFGSVFSGWRWTSTTSAMAPDYAWYVHTEGGRMFYGRKDSYSLLWPVRGSSPVLPETGQRDSFDPEGRDAQNGWSVAWPEPRFVVQQNTAADVGSVMGTVLDRLTGLTWSRSADVFGPVGWTEALEKAGALGDGWRVPTINELESLVDASSHSPALQPEHPFTDTCEAYWSSTSSGFEPDWAMVLYLHKGAVGVGYKLKDPFNVWLVQG